MGILFTKIVKEVHIRYRYVAVVRRMLQQQAGMWWWW